MLDLRLAVTDDPVADHPEKITCPPRIHKERTGGKLDKQSSLAVYPDHVHCYGCDYHRMGVYALAELLNVPLDEARTQESKFDSETMDAYRERAAAQARRDPLPAALATIYHDLLWTRRRDRMNWLLARGLDPDTITTFKLGHDGKRFTIPVFDREGHLITIRYRRDDAIDDFGPKYSGLKGRNGLYLYPEWLITKAESDYLWLVEGELDAARLWQEGQPALSATNGAGQTRKLPGMIREQFPWVKHLLIATDQDERGRAAAQQTMDAALVAGFDPLALTSLEWPEGKDITEALQLGYDYREGLAIAFGG